MDKNQVIAKLNKAVPDAVLEGRRFGRSGVVSLWLEGGAILKVAKLLKEHSEFQLAWLENLSVVEFEEALVANYFLASYVNSSRLILRISEVPKSPLERVQFLSTRSVWPMIEPMEREAADLFGIDFKCDSDVGPCDLETVLLPDDFIGYPLRKGYIFPKKVLNIPHARLQIRTGKKTDER